MIAVVSLFYCTRQSARPKIVERGWGSEFWGVRGREEELAFLVINHREKATHPPRPRTASRLPGRRPQKNQMNQQPTMPAFVPSMQCTHSLTG